MMNQQHAAGIQSIREGVFQWVPLDLAGDGAGEEKACGGVEAFCRKDQGGSAACLFVAGLWVEIDPDQLAAFRGYHSSNP